MGKPISHDTQIQISVQAEPFSLALLHEQLSQTQPQPGAVVTFTGLVRDFDNNKNIIALELEHYPGMTEKSLQKIAEKTAAKWSIQGITIIHRVGRLAAGDSIVAIGVASAHRKDAFSSCEFIMDFLKTEAPFWKKEIRNDGQDWVKAKQSDSDAMNRW